MATTWSINQMERYPTHGGEDDVVYRLHWTCSQTDTIDEVDYTSASYGSQDLATDDLDPFTEWADVTETIALGWLETAQGETNRAGVVAALTSQNNVQANPVTLYGLPWSS